MTEKVCTAGKGIILVDVNSLNKTGCCYMSWNFSVKRWYFHFKNKHFEKLDELIGGSEGKVKYEARLEFLQLKSAKFFRICLNSRKEKYYGQPSVCWRGPGSAEVLVDSWAYVDFIFAAAKANGILGCINKTTANRSQDAPSPILPGTYQAIPSTAHPALDPQLKRATKNWEKVHLIASDVIRGLETLLMKELGLSSNKARGFGGI